MDMAEVEDTAGTAMAEEVEGGDLPALQGAGVGARVKTARVAGGAVPVGTVAAGALTGGGAAPPEAAPDPVEGRTRKRVGEIAAEAGALARTAERGLQTSIGLLI
mmetsp:Transcript_33934/g.47015  ORF Transcript_33934/g.47015 Transcript_33934/m.47015 type:complete len:105 (+) Transcript_33934:161-475(+)